MKPKLSELLPALAAFVVALILYHLPMNVDNSLSAHDGLGEPGYLISPYDILFQRVEAETGVDWHLLSAIAYCESRYNPNQRSRRGAVGLMQLMPSTAKEFGVPFKYVLDPYLNVTLSAKLLLKLEESFNFKGVPQEEKYKIVLAAYNCGISNLRAARKSAAACGANVNNWDQLKQFGKVGNKQTRRFVDNVMRKWGEYRLRSLSLITD